MPAVSVLGVCVERPPVDGVSQDAVLVTRYLDYSMSYRYVFSHGHTLRPSDQLLDAMVELLVRLHLAGLFWGDCSLSNTLFRPDAGRIGAYLVDAETAAIHPSLSDGQRHYDVSFAAERVGGELLDLQAGGLLPADVDPIVVAADLPRRYRAPWTELTREEVFRPDEQRYRVAQRVNRLNELGFDVDELELITTVEGTRLRVHTQVAESGRHREQLFTRTGLRATENQARRMLNDVVSFRGYLEQKEGRPVSETVAAHRWRSEVFDKVLAMVPPELSDRPAPAEVFHEILEHRWFLSERAGTDPPARSHPPNAHFGAKRRLAGVLYRVSEPSGTWRACCTAFRSQTAPVGRGLPRFGANRHSAGVGGRRVVGSQRCRADHRCRRRWSRRSCAGSSGSRRRNATTGRRSARHRPAVGSEIMPTILAAPPTRPGPGGSDLQRDELPAGLVAHRHRGHLCRVDDRRTLHRGARDRAGGADHPAAGQVF
jgi:Domain of unknown function (DUF4032)